MTRPAPITHLPTGGIWRTVPRPNNNAEGFNGWQPRPLPPLAPEHDHRNHLDYQLPRPADRPRRFGQH